jgi:hypothetical protein
VTAGLKCGPEIDPKGEDQRDERRTRRDRARQQSDCDVAAGQTLRHDAGPDHGGQEHRSTTIPSLDVNLDMAKLSSAQVDFSSVRLGQSTGGATMTQYRTVRRGRSSHLHVH